MHFSYVNSVTWCAFTRRSAWLWWAIVILSSIVIEENLSMRFAVRSIRRRALVVAVLCSAVAVHPLATPQSVVRLTDAASSRPVVLIGTVQHMPARASMSNTATNCLCLEVSNTHLPCSPSFLPDRTHCHPHSDALQPALCRRSAGHCASGSTAAGIACDSY